MAKQWQAREMESWASGYEGGSKSAGWSRGCGAGPGGMTRGRPRAIRGIDTAHNTGIPSFSGQDPPRTARVTHSAQAVYAHKPAALFKLPTKIPGVRSFRHNVLFGSPGKSPPKRSRRAIPPEERTRAREREGQEISPEEQVLVMQIDATLAKQKDDTPRPKDPDSKGSVVGDEAEAAWLKRQEGYGDKLVALRMELRKLQLGELAEQRSVQTRKTRRLMAAKKKRKAARKKAGGRAAVQSKRLTLPSFDNPGELPDYLKDKKAQEELHTPHQQIGIQILTTLTTGRKLYNKVVEDVSEIFDAIDRDRGGKIESDELREGMQRLGVELDALQFQELFEGIDTDNDGTVTKEEFLAFLNECHGNAGDDANEKREIDLCEEIEKLQAERLRAVQDDVENHEKLDELAAQVEVARLKLEEVLGATVMAPRGQAYAATRVKKTKAGLGSAIKNRVRHKQPFNQDTRIFQSSRPGKRVDESLGRTGKPRANPRKSVWPAKKDEYSQIVESHSSAPLLNSAYTPGKPPYMIKKLAVSSRGVLKGKGHVYHGNRRDQGNASISTSHGLGEAARNQIARDNKLEALDEFGK